MAASEYYWLLLACPRLLLPGCSHRSWLLLGSSGCCSSGLPGFLICFPLSIDFVCFVVVIAAAAVGSVVVVIAIVVIAGNLILVALLARVALVNFVAPVIILALVVLLALVPVVALLILLPVARFYSLSFLLLLNSKTSEKTSYVLMYQSSESPPGGNQVDGLPLALSWKFYRYWANNTEASYLRILFLERLSPQRRC